MGHTSVKLMWNNMAKYPPVDHGFRRFAVLHHTGVEPAHYDLLFELNETAPLITFRMPRWPVVGTLTGMKLRDHRRVYLSFEGSIPGERGQVMRVDEGLVGLTETPTGWRLKLPDGRTAVMLDSENPQNPHENIWQITAVQESGA
jgi:hypothetical protein